MNHSDLQILFSNCRHHAHDLAQLVLGLGLLLCLPRQLPFPPLPSYPLYQKTKKNSLHTGTAPWQRSVTRLLLFS